MANLKKRTLNQIITATTSFTPSLNKQKLTITAALDNIPTLGIYGITVTDYAVGTNGVYATAGTPTPVIGTTYYVDVVTNIAGQNKPVQYPLQVTASTTSFADLINSFVTVANGKTGAPYLAANASTQLRFTAVPPTGYSAGEVTLNIKGIYDRAGNVLGTAIAATTSQVIPSGTYNQVNRIWLEAGNALAGQTLAGNAFVNSSAPISTSTYNTVTVDYFTTPSAAQLEPTVCRMRLFVDKTIADVDESYISTTMNNYAGQLGLSALGATVVITPLATAAAGSAMVPFGITDGSIAGNASNFVGITAGWPVGTTFRLTNDATAYKISTVGSETINGGTAAGSATVAASTTSTLTKVSATNWLGISVLKTGTSVATAFPATS